LEGLLLAAVKACGPNAVLSHFSASVLWEVLDWEERFPEVTVLGEGTRGHPRIRVHRTSVLDPIDVRVHKGIRVTSPARTLIDLAPLLAYNGLRRAVRQAQGMHLVNLAQLTESLNRLGPRRGARSLRKILSTGPAPTRSELEDVVLDLILSGGFEHPDVNRPLILDGRRVVPDFRWAEQRLVVEADGAAWHDNPVARADDAERQALLEAHGDRVLRVTWEQVVARPSQTLSRIEAAGAPTT
jgi:very-short-patch-repair endonuclease